MGRVVKFVLVLLCIAVGALIFGARDSVYAADIDTWAGKPGAVIASAPTSSPSFDDARCSGATLPIRIEGDPSYQQACVFGGSGGTRMARYRDGYSGYIYAIAFASDDRFLDIKGFCLGLPGCLYGSSEDTALLQMPAAGNRWSHAIIKNFTKQLVLKKGITRYYEFSMPSEPYHFVTDMQSATKSAAISSNGRWSIVELRDFGFLRVDLRTLETKRIVAPGATYGQGSDPVFELAISDDGRQVAVAGWGTGINVYEVTDGCGDEMTAISQVQFAPGTRSCRGSAIDTYSLFPGFMAAQTPRFASNGRVLSLFIQKQQSGARVLLAPEEPSERTDERYAALGDSFTSGEGELSDAYYQPGTNTASNHCHVSVRSYPFLVGAVHDIVTTNLACSGSRIGEVRQASRVMHEENKWPPKVISLSVGGNDIDMMGKLKTCIMPGTCEWARPEKRGVSAREIWGMFSRITELISDVKKTSPGSRVFIVGYPRVINDELGARCGPLLSSLLTYDERKYMNESIKYLNTVIKAASAYEGAQFVDIQDALMGERLCDASSDSMNAIRFGDDIAPVPFLKGLRIIGAESFHPTPRGHERVANIVTSTLASNGFWNSLSCSSCLFDRAQLEPAEYWHGGASDDALQTKQSAGTFLQKDVFKTTDLLKLTIPAGTFLPGTRVRIEVHSQNKLVGELVTEDSGAVEGQMPLPQIDVGYHTVHVIGESMSGDELDVYETIFIETPSIHLPGAREQVSSGETAPPVHRGRGGLALVIKDMGESSLLDSVPLTAVKDTGVVLGTTISKSAPTRVTKNPLVDTAMLVAGSLLVGLLLALGLGITVYLKKRGRSLSSDTD